MSHELDRAYEHDQCCSCAECWYQREQLAQDYREEIERAEYETYRIERGH